MEPELTKRRIMAKGDYQCDNCEIEVVQPLGVHIFGNRNVILFTPRGNAALTVTGNCNTLIGCKITACGNANRLTGDSCKVLGEHNCVYGTRSTIVGKDNFVNSALVTGGAPSVEPTSHPYIADLPPLPPVPPLPAMTVQVTTAATPPPNFDAAEWISFVSEALFGESAAHAQPVSSRALVFSDHFSRRVVGAGPRTDDTSATPQTTPSPQTMQDHSDQLTSAQLRSPQPPSQVRVIRHSSRYADSPVEYGNSWAAHNPIPTRRISSSRPYSRPKEDSEDSAQMVRLKRKLCEEEEAQQTLLLANCNDSEGTPACSVCLENCVRIALGCGHVCVCKGCFERVRKGDCPICKTKIASWKVVFVS